MIVLSLSSSWLVSMEGIVPERDRSRGMMGAMGERNNRASQGVETTAREFHSTPQSNLPAITAVRQKYVVPARPPAASAYPFMALDTTQGLPPSPDDVIDRLRELVEPAFHSNDPTALNIRAMALIGRLKSLNRAANNATRIHKDVTAEARHGMDQSHLQLQNLLYEKRHLEREIEKCRQFA